MRGRLIFPMKIQVHRLNTGETDAYASGSITSGYDDIFREPIAVDDGTGEGPGTIVRVEYDPVMVPVQIEQKRDDYLVASPTGNVNEVKYIFHAHFKWLGENGLVDITGQALIRVNDRVSGIYTYKDESLIQTFDPGIYVTESLPAGFGFGKLRNLLRLTCQDRSRGVPL